MTVFLSNCVHEVSAATKSLAQVHLDLILVAPLIEGWQNHLLQDAASPRIPRGHLFYKFRVASTSGAGVLSPVQLILRGASRQISEYPRAEYKSTIRFVA